MTQRIHPSVSIFVVALATVAALGLGCSAVEPDDRASLAGLREVAADYDLIFSLPKFESQPGQLQSQAEVVLAQADRDLQQVIAVSPVSATFEDTIESLDHIMFPVVTFLNRLAVIREAHAEADMRRAAGEQFDRVLEWVVGLTYREDVYRACEAFAHRLEAGEIEPLEGERLLLFEETMRDYRRAGLHLEAGVRNQVEALQNQINQLGAQFDQNISAATSEVFFTASELVGVPKDFLEQAHTEDGRYRVRSSVITDYLAVMQNALNEETRKRLKTDRFKIAQSENSEILNEILALRQQMAGLLGYLNWADYQIEPKMAKSSARVQEFLNRFVVDLDPKFQEELEALRQLKVADTGSSDARIEIWDFRYYLNQYQKQQFRVDAEALRKYFRFDETLNGMFDVYAEIFGLEFVYLGRRNDWAKDLELYATLDAETGEPLGMFFLDMFPRSGKYNHFAQFDLIPGKLLADGRYQRPVVALICNFTPATAEKPSLITHSEVETLFHEFGHALHGMLTQVTYSRFSGANVPGDFVEAPSQTLESWCWDSDVLARFAKNYENPADVIDADVLSRMQEADIATKGIYYRRQLALALSDLRMHMAGPGADAAQILNDTFAEVFLAPPEGSNMAAYWGHLNGYDAGYYGYAWADVIAADLASKFIEAPRGFMDASVGRMLRREIYAVGGSRDVEVSIREFLGREPNEMAFLRSIGLQ